MNSQSESLTKDWINLVVLIRTAKKTKRVKKIIKAKIQFGISISPKETINKSVNEFINNNSQILQANIKPNSYKIKLYKENKI